MSQGVVSFTLVIHPKPMQAKELLTVTPESLVASILKRRRAAAKRSLQRWNNAPKKTTERTSLPVMPGRS